MPPWLILEFLESSKRCPTAELPAGTAALQVKTLEIALCRCCTLCVRERPPYGWRVSIDGVPRRVAPQAICEEETQPPRVLQLVPTLAGPAPGTW